MTELVPTSHEQVREGLDAARETGMQKLNVGNAHMLWWSPCIYVIPKH